MSRSARLIVGAAVAGAALAGTLLAARAQQSGASNAADQSARLGLGRPALPEEVAAWDIDVRPDGQGLPPGKGMAKQGDAIFQAQCAACHGEFGEGVGRWPALAGGAGTLTADRPDKTVGSFWPDLSTVYDYIRRAMPYGNARSLSNDDVYALTAYLLSLNDIVTGETFELNDSNFATIRMPNAAAFDDDDRETAEKHFWTAAPCMTDCSPPQKVVGRATAVDVTPDGQSGPKVE